MKRDDIAQLYCELREETARKWDRVLPVGELLVDRWEKDAFLNFGEKTSIYDSSIVMGNVSVGKETWIGPGTLLDGTGGQLCIGDHCDISAGVQIYTHDTVRRCLSGGRAAVEKGDVFIGNNCYIAPMSLIARGVRIGSCCVVAAHSFVKDSFEDYSIIAGIPAVQIGEVRIEGEQVRLVYFGQGESGEEYGGKG